MSSLAPVWPFARVFIVHCRRLAARQRHGAAILARFGWEATWVESFDPGDIPTEVLRRVRNRKLTEAEVSVYAKHLSIWREVAEGDETVFVLEDDAVFPNDFAERCQTAYLPALPSRFDMVFFGGSGDLAALPAADNPCFGRGRGSRSMSGYLITGACARVLQAALQDAPIDAPVDLTLNDVIHTRGLVVYWSVPHLIDNGSETGLFAHSLGVGWRLRGWRGFLSRLRARVRLEIERR